MSRCVFLFVGALILTIGLAFSAQAATITQTGAELSTNNAVSFPTLTPYVLNDSLIFSTGNSHPVLVRWDLIAAGTVDAGDGDVTITVTLDTVRTSQDWDLSFGLWDGLHYAGIMPAADGMVFYSALQSLSNGILYNEQLSNPQGVAQILSAGSAQFTLEYVFGATQSLVNFTGLGLSVQLPLYNFDRTGAISLFVCKQSSVETAMINSITVTSDLLDVQTVPEPSTFVLAALGLLGIFGLRRRLG